MKRGPAIFHIRMACQFRRFQVGLAEPIEIDDGSKIPQLLEYGDKLGYKILNVN